MKILKDYYHGSMVNLLSKMKNIKRTENLNEEQIKILQKKRLQELLKHVLINSKFYRDYYKAHGITLDKIDKVQLKDLPIIDKKIMMDNYDDFVCESELKREELEKFISSPRDKGKMFKGKFQVIHTSGSTGTPGIFAYGPNDWAILKALVLTRVSKNKISLIRKTKLAFIGYVDGHYAGISLAQSAPTYLFDFLPLDINGSLEKIIYKLNNFQPDSLSGYASWVFFLAQEQLKGNLNIHPKRIICSADQLTYKMRDVIKEAFGVDPINFYAASESIGMAAQCDMREGLHLFNDWHCFEIVDETLKPVKAGESGKVIITTLYNYTQPLIRYQMNDELVLDEHKCHCNWAFPLIKSIGGRQEEYLWFELENGKKEFIHPTVMVGFIVPGLEKLQVIQEKNNTLLLKVVIRGDEESVIRGIRERMQEILKMNRLENVVSFRIEIVKDIKNDSKTGKYKLIIPLK